MGAIFKWGAIMRSLSATLTSKQQDFNFIPVINITFSKSGEDNVVIDETKILSIKYIQEAFSQKATVVCDNSDNYFDSLDFQAWQAVIAMGVNTSEGEETSNQPPIWVISQTFDSAPDHLTCSLELIGIPDRMALDHADVAYEPDDTDTDTVKTLIREIAGDSGVTMLACFNHTPTFDITFDTEDSLIDSYQPKSTFRVRIGDDRLAKIKELLEKTGCQFRAEDDGEIHIFVPTKTGTTYNSSYTLAEGGHTFFAKAYRNRLVIPNKVTIKSWDDDSPSYSGSATSATSYANMPIEETRQMTLASNAQGAAIAAAYIGNYELWSSAGSFSAPINVGLEVMDYISVVDARNGDSRTGNVGRVTFYYDAPTDRKDSRWSITVSYGDWTTVASKLAALGITGTELQNYFTRLYVKDLYAENITADQLNVVGINVAGEIILSQAEGDLDDIDDGSTYEKVKATSISAGNILVNSLTSFNGQWYDVSGVEIDATHGINIYGTANALTTRATKAGTIQCYVGADGKIYAGAGAVYLDSGGISLKGEAGATAEMLKFYDATPTLKGEIYYSSGTTSLTIQTLNSADIYLTSVSDITLKATHGITIAAKSSVTTATDNDVRIEADADIYIDASALILMTAGTTFDLNAVGDLTIRAGFNTASGDGDLILYAGRFNDDEGGDILIVAYQSDSPSLGGIYLDAQGIINIFADSKITIDSATDIELDPAIGSECQVTGDFSVTGDKNCVVETEDGRRLLFSVVESPEIWFEEKLSGILKDGYCKILLDERFTACTTINGEHPLHVVATPTSACNGLLVEKQYDKVIVREVGSGVSNTPFDITISAKRKGREDIRFDEKLYDADTESWYRKSKEKLWHENKAINLEHRRQRPLEAR